MNKLVSILIALVIPIVMTITSCGKEEIPMPEDQDKSDIITQKFDVFLERTSVILVYGQEAYVNFVYIGQNNITVSSKENHSEFSIKYEKTEDSHRLVLTADTDEDYTGKAVLIFSNGKESVEKEISIQITKSAEKFAVELKSNSVTICKNRPGKINYTARNAANEITVSIKEDPEGLQLTNVGSMTEGTMTFQTELENPSEMQVTLIFSDAVSECEWTVTVITEQYQEPTSIPSTPSVPETEYLLYPAEANHSLEIPFTVECLSPINEVTVIPPVGTQASITYTSDDKKTGKVTLTATDSFGFIGILNITASNDAGQATESVIIKKVTLKLDKQELSVEPEATQNKYSIEITKNINCLVELPEDSFVAAELDDSENTIYLNIQENMGWDPRETTLTVKDPENLLVRTVKITQAGTNGNNQTDTDALMAIHKALNIKDWSEAGAFGTYYSNWGTSATKDKWLGTTWTLPNGEGRCWHLDLTCYNPVTNGNLPEDIGNMTGLVELEIGGQNLTFTKMPQSIAKLKKLQCLCFHGTLLDCDLKDWTGLKELAINPENQIKAIYLARTKIHGTFPEWVAQLPEDFKEFTLIKCHISGQVPDAVTQHPVWNKIYPYESEELDKIPRFDGSKYEKDNTRYIISLGDLTMYTQLDNYALWVGERPENTKWVDDKFGGHWEWTD